MPLSSEQQLFAAMTQRQQRPTFWMGGYANWNPPGEVPTATSPPEVRIRTKHKQFHDVAKVVAPALLDMFGNNIPYHPPGLVHGQLIDKMSDNPDWDVNDILRYLDSPEAANIKKSFEDYNKSVGK